MLSDPERADANACEAGYLVAKGTAWHESVDPWP